MTDLSSTQEPVERKLTLKPARLDFIAVQPQMVLGIVLAVLLSVLVYAPTLNCGFLLDDFLHMDYITRAAHGDWHDFLNNFTSNWAGSDIMKSYRPLVSLSLFTDHLVWGARAWGYHLTNILLMAGCSAFVALTTVEITGLTGNRLRATAAVWAGILFALYPLHVESTAWVIGRVDLLCTLFYLISIWSYLRFRLIREKKYFVMSLACFVGALFSKEMAATLPVVITCIELLLHEQSKIVSPPEYQAMVQAKRRLAVLYFWFILGIAGSHRFLLFGTMVGGYGDAGGAETASIGATFISSLRNFLNVDSLKQILYPVNLDLIARTGDYAFTELLKKILLGSYLTILAAGLVRLLLGTTNRRVIAFLLIWTAVSVLPTFQIWQISPNLVGSRLFFLGSAPAIILLTLLAVPAIDAMKPALAKAFSIVGSLALLIILSIWSYWMQLNLTSWQEAGVQVSNLISSVKKELDLIPEDKKILVLNLPTDYSGAGMITRPQYLAFVLRPPYTQTDLSTRVETIEPTISGSHTFMWPDKFKHLVESGTKTFIWRDKSGSSAFLGEWSGAPAGLSAETTWSVSLPEQLKLCKYKAGTDANWVEPKTSVGATNLKLSEIPITSTTEWKINHQGGMEFEIGYDESHDESGAGMPSKSDKSRQAAGAPRISKNERTQESNGLLVHPGSESGVTIVFPKCELNPLKTNVVRVHARMLTTNCPPLELAWSDQAVSGEAGMLPVYLSNKPFVVWAGRHRNWTLARGISQLALKAPPGKYSFVISKIEVLPQDLFVPTLTLNKDTGTISIDGSKVSGAKQVRLVVLRSNMSFDAVRPDEVNNLLSSQSGTPIMETKTIGRIGVPEAPVLDFVTGTAKIKDLVPNIAGSYFMRVQLTDAEGRDVGLPSEPVLVERK